MCVFKSDFETWKETDILKLYPYDYDFSLWV